MLYKLSIVLLLMFGFGTIVSADVNEVNRFARCINKSGAKFYGAWWCPHCKKQKDLFGKHAQRLPYIECSNSDSRKQSKKCKGVKGYPTWKFKDGSIARGVQSLQKLADYTNCPAPRKK